MMWNQNLRKCLFYEILFVTIFLSQSPRAMVESRSIQRREAPITTPAPTTQELTTQPNKSFTNALNPLTTVKASDLQSIATTSAPNQTTETTTVITESENLESHRFTPSTNVTRSLYEELMSTSNFPSFSSSFETSSEFMKFENSKMSSNSEESKSDESLEKKFENDELGFKTNATLEERHTINEAVFDEESVKYSSIKMNSTRDEDTLETTAMPVVLTTMKKGKYLDLIRRGDDNINASIPNTAEVWALAGMRDFDKKRSSSSDDSSSDVELIEGGLNSTAKNLLDWSEIAKMNNDSMMQSSSTEEKQKEFDLSETTVVNEINGADDPATSENKGVGIFVASSTTLPTSKTIIEDNRLELEVESGNGDFGGANKTKDMANSRIDSDVFSKSLDEGDESAVELIDPFKTTETTKMKESLKADEAETKPDVLLTTESAEAEGSTESAELLETSTMESFETTTSIVDSFTVIGEDDEVEDVFKRTITEQPILTTVQPLKPTSQTLKIQTTTVEATTDIPSSSVNEIPETTLRYNKSTKSIRLATTTTTLIESPSESSKSTVVDNEGLSSTLLPKYTISKQILTTTQQYDVSLDTTSSPTIEIVDDDKFKYSTLLPETTTYGSESVVLLKNNNFEESTTNNGGDNLNKEILEGEPSGSSSNLGIISASVSVVILIAVAGVAYFVFKRRNNLKFSQRCRPVGLDAYSLDNVSVYNSVRRKANALRLSKRSYGNSAFEDPSLQSNVLDYQSLQDFSKNKTSIQDEFKEIPQVSVRVDEMPENCEDKNRYANVVPLPETRVLLQRQNDDEKTEYINANFVKGPKDSTNYYIATQAPLENTVCDFWRMLWEQNSKVIIMVTDLSENGVERCAEYIPASVVLDNAQIYGDFQVTLKSREVKGKYAVSQLHLKNLKTNTWREIMHLWYSWPENGCPTDESSVVSLLLEARGYLRNTLPEHLDENSNAEANKNMNEDEKISTLDKTKSLQRVQGPLTVHCSPGTGRTGTVIACDIILRMLETPPRQIDIPQIVYTVRRGRANAIRTKDQYEFIYSIANTYAIKLNAAPTES